jgi:tetratricopeptide (TPR) repeat protein
MALLAQGLIAAKRIDEALDTLGRALTVTEATGEHFYEAELLRLKGEVLASLGETAQAEECLRGAIDISRSQEARLFELRSAVSLCRLLDAPHRQAAVQDDLGALCAWFGHAADSADVRSAAAILRDARP